MKPRLERASMDVLDVAIWLHRAATWDRRGAFMPAGYLTADRRDADLMFALRTFRAAGMQLALEMPNIWWLREPEEPRWAPAGGDLRNIT